MNVAKLKRIISTVGAQAVLNLMPQIANSLLSDGKGWKDFDKMLSATITALLEALRESGIQLLVHASYAFLYSNAKNATENTLLSTPGDDSIFAAAIAAENRVLNGKTPTCLLRLGYLYGPQSQDLKPYIKPFQLRRPYFVGLASRATGCILRMRLKP